MGIYVYILYELLEIGRGIKFHCKQTLNYKIHIKLWSRLSIRAQNCRGGKEGDKETCKEQQAIDSHMYI